MNNTLNHNSKPMPARHASLAGWRLLAGVLCLATASFTSTVVQADNHQRTRADAVEMAKKQSGGGRVLSVNKRVNKNGVSVYAVKIITDGRVKVFRIPERTP